MLWRDKKTKIIATIGPYSDSPQIIRSFIRTGVNVFRFNMKHADAQWHRERIKRVQAIADQEAIPIGILIDLQGPEIRIHTKYGQRLKVKKNQEIILGTDNDADIQINPKIFEALKQKDKFVIDDGFIHGTIIKKTKKNALAKILTGGEIQDKKSINIPNLRIKLPTLVKEDIERLDVAAKEKVDFIALSFTRTQEDIEDLRLELKRRGVDAQIVAKIENQEALENIEEIIETADAIMIARGDLGIEIPIEKIAYYQKEIIKKCREHRKPVIVATQMLESMLHNPIPTRAEATDVANAVYDGADAVMLSAETAIGKYPVQAVKAMAKILKFNEKYIKPEKIFPKSQNLTELIVDAVISMLQDQKKPTIDALVVFTETGYSAKVLSRFRPNIAIIAITDRPKTVDILTLYYGVTTFLTKFPKGLFRIPENILSNLVKKGILKQGQTIVLMHGQHRQAPGLTNAIAIVKL